MKMDSMKKMITSLFLRPPAQFIPLSFAAAYLSGGFIAGLFMCENCSLSEPVGYLIISIIIGILSIVTGGFPPANEGGVGAPLNTWPYILVCWLFLAIMRLVVKKRQL